MFAAHRAEFHQFQAFFEDFFILGRVIIRVLALGAFEFDQIILGHMN